MEKKRHTAAGIIASVAMLVIILDGKTALISIQDGITLCVKTVIPALFPFFLLSGLITDWLLDSDFMAFRILGKICKLPKGSEKILAVGFLFGYPVGAQLTAQAYKEKKIPTATARRMLGFCSNAGPAFLFGMLSSVFENPVVSWVLWIIQIVSALIVGFLLPVKPEKACKLNSVASGGITVALNRSIRNMVLVCGWVLLFRVVLGYCDRWFLWLFPLEIRVFLCGMLELSNGCAMLRHLPSEGMRFISASIMLSFGGLCVMMQTQSVTQGLGMGYYFPGKALQMLISAALSIVAMPVIFHGESLSFTSTFAILCLIGVCVLLLVMLLRKKVVAIGRRMLYNTGS